MTKRTIILLLVLSLLATGLSSNTLLMRSTTTDRAENNGKRLKRRQSLGDLESPVTTLENDTGNTAFLPSQNSSPSQHQDGNKRRKSLFWDLSEITVDQKKQIFHYAKQLHQIQHYIDWDRLRDAAILASLDKRLSEGEKVPQDDVATSLRPHQRHRRLTSIEHNKETKPRNLQQKRKPAWQLNFDKLLNSALDDPATDTGTKPPRSQIMRHQQRNPNSNASSNNNDNKKRNPAGIRSGTRPKRPSLSIGIRKRIPTDKYKGGTSLSSILNSAIQSVYALQAQSKISSSPSASPSSSPSLALSQRISARQGDVTDDVVGIDDDSPTDDLNDDENDDITFPPTEVPTVAPSDLPTQPDATESPSVITESPTESPTSSDETSPPTGEQTDDNPNGDEFRDIPVYNYTLGNCPDAGDSNAAVPCAPSNICDICDKYEAGSSFSACFEACRPSFCCVHDAPPDTNRRSPNCNTDVNCAQYACCYIVWWKFSDTIGPATELRLEQTDDFFDVDANAVQGDVTGNEFLQELLFHHFDDSAEIERLGTDEEGFFISDRIFLNNTFWETTI